jgi:hypothetical protein
MTPIPTPIIAYISSSGIGAVITSDSVRTKFPDEKNPPPWKARVVEHLETHAGDSGQERLVANLVYTLPWTGSCSQGTWGP